MDFEALLAAVRVIFVGLFPTISSGDWQQLPAEDRAKLNKLMHTINDVYNDKLRRVYDRQVWDGNKVGKYIGNTNDADSKNVLANQLRPVRAETVRKDGTTAAPVSADEMFDAMAGIEPVTAETPVTLDEV